MPFWRNYWRTTTVAAINWRWTLTYTNGREHINCTAIPRMSQWEHVCVLQKYSVEALLSWYTLFWVQVCRTNFQHHWKQNSLWNFMMQKRWCHRGQTRGYTLIQWHTNVFWMMGLRVSDVLLSFDLRENSVLKEHQWRWSWLLILVGGSKSVSSNHKNHSGGNINEGRVWNKKKGPQHRRFSLWVTVMSWCVQACLPVGVNWHANLSTCDRIIQFT